MLDAKLLSSFFTLIAGVAAAVMLIALQPEPRMAAGASRTAQGSSAPGATAPHDATHACAALAASTRSRCAAGAAEAPPCNTPPQSVAAPCGDLEPSTHFTHTLAIRSKS